VKSDAGLLRRKGMRVVHREAMPEAVAAMLGLQKVVDDSGLEATLLELIKVRASQINGCAYCLDIHTKDALAIGEDPRRLNVLAAWRESPFYSQRERAALAWCESLTLLSSTGAPDAVYEELAAKFSPHDQVAVTAAIVAINGWNRFAVGFRSPVGSYVSKRHPVHATKPN
jgi:AhpD family alkylhydroperoxidase